jgi:hypothetical protein
VQSERKIEFDSDHDMMPSNGSTSSADQAVESVSFTNIVYSPPSLSSPGKNVGAALLRRLFAVVLHRFFKFDDGEKEPTLLEVAERFNR